MTMAYGGTISKRLVMDLFCANSQLEMATVIINSTSCSNCSPAELIERSKRDQTASSETSVMNLFL